MNRSRLPPLLCILALGLVRPGLAYGQDEARAEALFNEGKAARDRGDHAAACAKFTESLGLVRRASTMLNLSLCLKQTGKLALALDQAQQAMAMLPAGDPRASTAKEVLDELGGRVPRLVVKLPADAPPDARVAIDGNAVSPEALSQPIAVDPGTHAVVLSAPGHADSTTEATVAEREKREITLALGASTARPAPSEPFHPAPAAVPPAGSPTRRTLGFVAAGVGAGGLVAAAITGGLIVSKDATIQKNCPNKRCNPDGLVAIDQSDSLIVANYVALGIGVTGIAVGAILILTSRPSSTEKRTAAMAARWAAAALPGGGALSLGGGF